MRRKSIAIIKRFHYFLVNGISMRKCSDNAVLTQISPERKRPVPFRRSAPPTDRRRMSNDRLIFGGIRVAYITGILSAALIHRKVRSLKMDAQKRGTALIPGFYAIIHR